MNRLKYWSVPLAALAVASAASAAPERPDRLVHVLFKTFRMNEFVPGEILVQFKPEAETSMRGASFAAVAADEVEHIRTAEMKDAGEPGVHLLRVPGDMFAAMATLKADPRIEFAEPNWVYRTQATSNDTHYVSGILWGMYGDLLTPRNVYGSQANEAWNVNHLGSSNVYVGVIDEGVMFTHTDLSPNFWLNPFDPVNGVDNDGNGYIDDTRGWDFAGNNNSVYDGTMDDHGTHVAGTIGARGGNGTGVAGVTWYVKLIAAKFLGSSGGTTANAIKAVDYITNLKNRHGLNIVATNNSWGGGGYSQGLADAISRANSANILFVAAAGNGGSDGIGDNNDSIPNYPSNYTHANVIAVASITSSGARSSFSNYGATSVDLGAPGSSIASCYPSSVNGYAYMSGTSMATPHVTGAAALYKATFPSATAAQIKAAILGAAVPTSSLSGRCVTGGRLNVSGF